MWVDAGNRGRVRGLPCGMDGLAGLGPAELFLAVPWSVHRGSTSHGHRNRENKTGSRSGEDGRVGELFVL